VLELKVPFTIKLPATFKFAGPVKVPLLAIVELKSEVVDEPRIEAVPLNTTVPLL
jgi:hypothetical protein